MKVDANKRFIMPSEQHMREWLPSLYNRSYSYKKSNRAVKCSSCLILMNMVLVLHDKYPNGFKAYPDRKFSANFVTQRIQYREK